MADFDKNNRRKIKKYTTDWPFIDADELDTDEDDTLLRHRARHKRQDDLDPNDDLQDDLRAVDPEEQKRQFQTRLFGDVEVVIKG